MKERAHRLTGDLKSTSTWTFKTLFVKIIIGIEKQCKRIDFKEIFVIILMLTKRELPL